MTSNSQTDRDDESDREAVLWNLLESLLTSHGDRQPDWSQVATEHSEYVNELRELYATAMVAEEFGKLANSDAQETISVSPPISTSSDGAGRVHVLPDVSLGCIGDYELLEEIGRGGMGVVFRARQISLDRIVALKMILQGNLASEEELTRFRSEAEAIAKLDHPHIVPIYEVGEWEGQPFFSMRYVDGPTLSQRLIDGPLSNREATELMVPICEAIEHAHRQGILHRDLKPSNILLDRQGRPFITDFGLAKQFSRPSDVTAHREPSLTESGAILGTPSYMAPEQAAGRRGEIGPASDVYSLGAILYAMLTSRAPFQAASPVDTVLLVLEQDPLPPRLLNKGVDSDLEMITLKCLQKPTDLRYPSVDSLKRDLESAQRGEVPSVRSSHFTQVLSRMFRETHHAGILENWGLLWMWHSLVLFGLCVVTNGFQLANVTARWPYVTLWTLGLGIWAACFWSLRHLAGPVTFVERQVAHVWAGAIGVSSFLFWVEAVLELPVLSMSCVLPLIAAMVFMVKAGILSGHFYVQALIMYFSAVVMAGLRMLSESHGWPDLSLTFYGLVSAGCFFVPGWKYWKQRQRGESD
ncbi:serine/threonine-protein kinase [Thalassoroseus pseudoceratinae]|uniref:serine/threonine-protein kinase n=1 Tax=Thalassoroseus pseudoceratinae TaxID=2713176 RepID=UPI0014227E4C|nr:serine/threonine-protein kinase [Thalassoroseus pseudoceratinae]